MLQVASYDCLSCSQGHDEQDKLLTLMDAGATLASAAGAAGRPSEDGASSAAGGLRGGPSGLRRLAAAAAHPERFILSIAACKVHEERPDPRRATATLDQQRCAYIIRYHPYITLSNYP